MDGEPVREGSPDDAVDGSDDGSAHVTPISLAEMFMKLCPAYMAMGMTWDEFWHRNTKVHWAYRKAWEQKKAYRNWEMWWQGSYIYEALLKVAPVMRAAFGKGTVEPGKYSDEPYPMSKKEAEERAEAKRVQSLKRLFETLNRESSKNTGTKDLEAKGD